MSNETNKIMPLTPEEEVPSLFGGLDEEEEQTLQPMRLEQPVVQEEEQPSLFGGLEEEDTEQPSLFGETEQPEVQPPQEKDMELGSAADFIKGVKEGVREELAPYSFSPEEIEKMKTSEASWTSVVGNISSSIASGVAGAYAAGKAGSMLGFVVAGPVGSVVGAGAGALGYAVYTGIGQEYLQSQISEKEFSPTRAAARTFLNVNPIARVNSEVVELAAKKVGPKAAEALKATESKAARVGRAVVQTVGEGAVAYSTTDSAATGLLTAVIAGPLSGLAFATSKAAPSTDVTRNINDLLDDPAGQDFATNVAKKAKELSAEDVKLKDDTDTEAFTDYILTRPGITKLEESTVQKLSAKKKRELLQEVLGKGGDDAKGGVSPEEVQNLLKGFRLHQYAMEEATSLRQKMQKEYADLVIENKSVKEVEKEMTEAFNRVKKVMTKKENILSATPEDLAAFVKKPEKLEALQKDLDTVQQFTSRTLAKKGGELENQDFERALTKLRTVEAFQDPFGTTFSWVADGQYVARGLDRITGTNTATILNKLSETRGSYELQAAQLFKAGREAAKIQRRVRINGKKMTNEQMGRLRSFLSEKNDRAITPELKAYVDIETYQITDENLATAVRAWDKAFELGRSVIQDQGFIVGNIKNYIPLRHLPRSQLATRVRRSARSLNAVAFSMGKPSLFSVGRKDLIAAGIKGKELEELVEEAQELKLLAMKAAGKEAEELGSEDVATLINGLIKTHGEAFNFGTELGVIRTREGQPISDRYRQFDIGDAFINYVNSQVRSAMFAKQHSDLANNLAIYKKLGMNKVVEWFEDHMFDMTGGGGTPSQKITNHLRDSATAFQFNSVRFFENLGIGDKSAEKVARLLPNLVGAWQANLYPAYLGYNLKATLRNTTQVFATLAPELGGSYGYALSARAYIKVLTQGRDEQGNFSLVRMAKELDRKGLGGDGRLAEGIQEPDVLSGALFKIPRAINQVGMTIYTSADILNRGVTYQVGRELAQGLAANDPKALKAFQKLGKAGLAQFKAAGMKDAIEQGNLEEVADILGKFLISKTQYHYGAEQKARFARFVGPLFSMFTKWPTSQIGNIYDIYKENPNVWRRTKRYFEVYGGPLTALFILDEAAREMGLREEGLYNYAVGDLKDISPLLSLEFTLFQNPAVEVAEYIGKTAKAALEAGGTEEAIGRSAAKTTKKLLTTSAPPLSSVLNELERFEKGYEGRRETTVDETLKDIFE